MWCDTFDADLLKVVPGAAEALGDTADVKLLTRSRLTDGKISHPSCWHTDHGLAAFFWTGPGWEPGESYVTSEPVAECTFLEAVRDEWVHSCLVVVNRRVVWRPPSRGMTRLMYDVREWTPMDGAEREETRREVLRSLEGAAERLRAALGAGET